MRLIKNILLAIFLLGVIHGKGQSLDSLLQQATKNHPELNALLKEFEATEQRAEQVNQLPQPTIGVGVPVLRPETRLGPQLLMVGVSQMFPWFGTLDSKKEMMLSMSKVKYERITATRLNIQYEVSAAYRQLQFLKSKRIILEAKKENYRALKNIVLGKVEAGKTSLANALRVDLMLNELTARLDQISVQEKIQSSKINRHTGEPLETLISVEVSDVVADPVNLTELSEKVKANHPLVKQLDWKTNTAELAMDVNKRANSPKIGLGLDYNLVGERTDMNPMDNGRDILVPKVKLSVPIYRKAYHAKNREEELKIESYTAQKENVIDGILQMLYQQNEVIQEQALELELMGQQIATSESTINLLLDKYSASGTGFDELLKLEDQLLGFELGKAMSHLKIALAQAKIEQLTNYE